MHFPLPFSFLFLFRIQVSLLYDERRLVHLLVLGLGLCGDEVTIAGCVSKLSTANWTFYATRR